jgi:hypothetical protein
MWNKVTIMPNAAVLRIVVVRVPLIPIVANSFIHKELCVRTTCAHHVMMDAVRFGSTIVKKMQIAVITPNQSIFPTYIATDHAMRAFS